jgi:hypothetical protein
MKPLPRWAFPAVVVVATILLVFRVAYIVDCRRSSGQLLLCWERGPLALPTITTDQWVQILAASGLTGGLAGFAGWTKGFNTYNPNLTRPRDD